MIVATFERLLTQASEIREEERKGAIGAVLRRTIGSGLGVAISPALFQNKLDDAKQ